MQSMDVNTFISKITDPALKKQVQAEYDALVNVEDSGGVIFKPEDFKKKAKTIGRTMEEIKKTAVEIEEEIEVASNNVFKAVAELSDIELKDKFDGDISVANQFLDNLKQGLGIEPNSAYKSFNKKFYEDFRKVITEKLKEKTA